MNPFNLKEHHQKALTFSKQAAKGVYPSKKTAKIGSIIGMILGAIFILIGISNLLLKNSWGTWTVFGGVVMFFSNFFTLRRIK